jgi:hypothetical protein
MPASSFGHPPQRVAEVERRGKSLMIHPDEKRPRTDTPKSHPGGTMSDIAENWNFAAEFPNLPENLIERPHLLRTMAEALSREAPLLFLEGDEGDGATTTLAQFCTLYADQTFSMFIKPASSLTYSIDFLRLSLAEQFHWYVYGSTLQKDVVTASEYEDLRIKALRRDKNRILYFVVDGLHQIPSEDRSVLTQVFKEVLPTGVARCRFIVTGLQTELTQYIHSSISTKHYRLLKFSIEESRTFLKNISIDDCDSKKIYELCRGGSPGRLAVVRRLLEAGTALETILDTDPAKYLEFVKLEFDILSSLTDIESLAVAVLAYSKISLSLYDLSATVGMAIPETSDVLLKCQFIRKPSGPNIEFVSETHRKYATKALARLERPALEAQLQQLQKAPSSEASLRFLPAYLETLSRQEAVLQLLSKEHYSSLLDSTQSFSALKAQAEMGLRSAQTLQRASEVFKFCLQRSIFTSATTAGGSSERIKALVALGQSNAAMALANGEATKEGRLALLAGFARRLMEKRGAIDIEIRDYIVSLISEVDFASMGDEAMKIAADVLIFDPDAAIGVIDSAVKGATEAVKNAAYAELSFSATMAKMKNGNVEDKARARISDQALQEVANSFAIIAERMDFDELLKSTSRMPSAHKIHFLRSLVGIKKEDLRILDLVELGLDTIIRETEYVPRCKDLADLCAPFMSKIQDLPRLKGLIVRFESQLGLVSKAAQSRDLTVLQMRLAAGELQLDTQLAAQRIDQAYYQIFESTAPEVQLECLAIMLGMLTRMDQDGELERRDGFRAVIKADLESIAKLVLKDTADHITTIMPALKALAADDCAAALSLSGKLNVMFRRDLAYETVASVIVSRPFSETRLQALLQALAHLSSDELRSNCVVGLLSALDGNIDKCTWLPYLERFRPNLLRGFQLCKFDCWLFKEAPSAGYAFAADLLVSRSIEAISRAASPLEEANIRFKLAESLAEAEPTVAQAHYDEGVLAAQRTPFGSSVTIELYEMCLSLVGRSIAPLARASMLDDDKFRRHIALIEELPGVLSKVRVLNEFAERLWCIHREDLVNRIVNENLRPVLEEARTTHSSVGRVAVRLAFPALSAAHLSLALTQLVELSPEDADTSLHDAAMLRLRRLSNREPESRTKFGYGRLTVMDVTDVIELIGHARSDSLLFILIRTLVEAITDKSNRAKFSSTQRADWSGRLLVVINTKLPDKLNILHEGYKIAALAQIYRLNDSSWSKWEDLEIRAGAVPNSADRGYIFSILASALPPRHAASHRRRFLEKAVREIETIPSPVDRLSHLQSCAEELVGIDQMATARECLKTAMTLCLDMDGSAKVSRHRRELIDLAYQIDSGFADELIALVDDDPARARLKSDAKQAAIIAKANKDMANVRQIKDISACQLDILPTVAWKNLGALEAGRLEVKSSEITSHYVVQTASSTLYQAYPVLSWHLANLERKYTSESDMRGHLVPICEAMLLSTELTLTILRKLSGKTQEIKEDPTDGLLVRRRDRYEAVDFISQWLRNFAGEEVIYCDAYFSTKDTGLLRLFLANCPHSRILILASKSWLVRQDEFGAEAFNRAWKEESDQDPPDVEVLSLAYVDTPSKNVVHDRWLISGLAGLRLGTSFNSLGTGKLSEISEMLPEQVAAVADQINKYRVRHRVVDGARLQYSSFTL